MANPTAVLDTSLGKIKVELFVDRMPITAKNFLKLAESGNRESEAIGCQRFE